MSRSLFESALESEGVTGTLAKLARSIYFQESSGGKNTKTSNAGAVGGMQIIPPTFKRMADKDWDISNPEHNARAGIRYLKQLDKQSGGDPALTAAGYYGGERGLEKARRGIAVSDPRNPTAPNTLQYGQQVAARMGIAQAQAARQQERVAQAPARSPQMVAPPSPAQGGPGAVPVQAGGGIELPAELRNYLASRGSSATASAPAATNAWLSFLNTVRPGGSPTGQTTGTAPSPVQAEDIDYAGMMARAPVPQVQYQPIAPGRVDFGPFAGFGRWGAQA